MIIRRVGRSLAPRLHHRVVGVIAPCVPSSRDRFTNSAWQGVHVPLLVAMICCHARGDPIIHDLQILRCMGRLENNVGRILHLCSPPRLMQHQRIATMSGVLWGHHASLTSELCIMNNIIKIETLMVNLRYWQVKQLALPKSKYKH